MSTRDALLRARDAIDAALASMSDESHTLELYDFQADGSCRWTRIDDWRDRHAEQLAAVNATPPKFVYLRAQQLTVADSGYDQWERNIANARWYYGQAFSYARDFAGSWQRGDYMPDVAAFDEQTIDGAWGRFLLMWSDRLYDTRGPTVSAGGVITGP